MDLTKNGDLIRKLRKAKGMTQKQVAEMLGILPKTVSKWETGKGFPDVSVIGELAKILGVSTDSVLSGEMKANKTDSGNMKKVKFYMCSECGNISMQTGNGVVLCCGRQLMPYQPEKGDSDHKINVETLDGDFYITFPHEMTKEHYLKFFAYVRWDGIYIKRLYPEQNGEVRFPAQRGGILYYCCSRDGLFEQKI